VPFQQVVATTQLLLLILTKASFDHKVSNFFKNYLVDKKTKYLWNSFSSLFYIVDVGISQELTLLLILSALYLSLIFYILENYLKNLKTPISILSFMDNGLFIAQHKSISISNMNLYCSYNVISTLLIRFGLVVKHGKTKVFHFSSVKNTNDGLQFLFLFSFYLLVFFISCLFSIFRTRVRV